MLHLDTVRFTVLLAAGLLAMPVPGNAQGWYMLTPPVVRGSATLNEAAPLPRWRPSPLYESARECEQIRSNWVAAVKRFESSLRRARALGARCMAATDPRLTSETPPAAAQTGWYLLAPPQRRDPRPSSAEQGAAPPSVEHANLTAPLAQWSHSGSFDSEAECETARPTQAGGGSTDRPPSQCISVADRRLAAGTPP